MAFENNTNYLVFKIAMCSARFYKRCVVLCSENLLRGGESGDNNIFWRMCESIRFRDSFNFNDDSDPNDADDEGDGNRGSKSVWVPDFSKVRQS